MKKIAICSFAAVFTSAAMAATPLHVMWDNSEIDLARTTAARQVHKLRYAGDLFALDKPWEGDGCGFVHVFADEDARGRFYRMYYMAWSLTAMINKAPDSVGPRVAYRESRDGIHWNCPSLGICTYRGTKDNNMLFTLKDYGGSWDNFFVFKDTNPKCPPDRLYKGVSGKDALTSFYSADGIHFKYGAHMIEIIKDEMKFDTHNLAFWDAPSGVYRTYVRAVHKPLPGFPFNDWRIREVRMASSPDFVTWSVPKPLVYLNAEDGTPAEDIPLYTNGVQPYPRDPGLRVGFPTRYIERKAWDTNFGDVRVRAC